MRSGKRVWVWVGAMTSGFEMTRTIQTQGRIGREEASAFSSPGR